MSIAVRFQPTNLTAEKYDESHPKLEAVGFPPPGLEYHVCFGTPERLAVSEVWASREDFDAWTEKLMPVLAEFGLELAGPPEIVDVHSVVTR